MLRYLIITAVLFGINIDSYSQFQYKTGKRELVRFSEYQKLSGWHFGLGATYMATRFRNTVDLIEDKGTILDQGIADPGGRFGIYAEVGRHRVFQYMRFINYIDYGLAFKTLRGKEEYTFQTVSAENKEVLSSNSVNSQFSNWFALAYFNANNVWQVEDYGFIQNSIGLNLDYRVVNRAAGDSYLYQDPGNWIFQLHYKLGYGFKIHDRLFIIPTIETPILNFIPWDNGKSTLTYFSSRYRPLILSVRIALLGNKGNSCPPVYSPDGDSQKQEQFMQQSR